MTVVMKTNGRSVRKELGCHQLFISSEGMEWSLQETETHKSDFLFYFLNLFIIGTLNRDISGRGRFDEGRRYEVSRVPGMSVHVNISPPGAVRRRLLVSRGGGYSGEAEEV